MLRIKNSQLGNIIFALTDLGNRTNDIKVKWEFRKTLTPFLNANSILQDQINEIIKEEGEKGRLDPLNKTYKELLDCDIEVDSKTFTLEELDKYNPTVEHLIALEPLIEEI
ncbi:MAG: hypothetical protein RR585_01435 [Coprobacillus sp.]